MGCGRQARSSAINIKTSACSVHGLQVSAATAVVHMQARHGLWCTDRADHKQVSLASRHVSCLLMCWPCPGPINSINRKSQHMLLFSLVQRAHCSKSCEVQLSRRA